MLLRDRLLHMQWGEEGGRRREEEGGRRERGGVKGEGGGKGGRRVQVRVCADEFVACA